MRSLQLVICGDETTKQLTSYLPQRNKTTHAPFVWDLLTQAPNELVFGPQVTKAIVAVRDDNLCLADQALTKFASTNADRCLVVEPGAKRGKDGLIRAESKRHVELLERKHRTKTAITRFSMDLYQAVRLFWCHSTCSGDVCLIIF